MFFYFLKIIFYISASKWSKNINLNKIKIKFFKKYFKNVKINRTEYDHPNKSLHIFAEERKSLKLKYYRLELLHQNTNINCSFPPAPAWFKSLMSLRWNPNNYCYCYCYYYLKNNNNLGEEMLFIRKMFLLSLWFF